MGVVDILNANSTAESSVVLYKDRRSTVRRVVREIIANMQQKVTPAVVEARAMEDLMALIEPDERPSERRMHENAALLAEMAADGNTRSSAMKVAKRRSGAPLEQERIAKHARRLLLREKRAMRVCFPKTGL